MSTICAISTAPGTGGIAVIRISGAEAIPLTERVFRPRNPKKQLSLCEANSLTYGRSARRIDRRGRSRPLSLSPLFHWRRHRRVELSRLAFHPATTVASLDRCGLPISRTRRVRPPSLHEWKDGLEPSRGCCRPDRLHLGRTTPIGSQPNARRIQPRIRGVAQPAAPHHLIDGAGARL